MMWYMNEREGDGLEDRTPSTLMERVDKVKAEEQKGQRVYVYEDCECVH